MKGFDTTKEKKNSALRMSISGVAEYRACCYFRVTWWWWVGNGIHMMGEYNKNVVYPEGVSSIQVKEIPSNWEQTTRDFLPVCFKTEQL